MKKYLSIAAGLTAGAALMLAAAPVMARVDVSVSVGVPGIYYVAPAPVYVQPRPVYIEQHYHRGWHERQWHGRRHGRRDQDRDGIPNRVDRDRDGDRVPNRYDGRPRNPYRY